MSNEFVDISELVGKTLTKIEYNKRHPDKLIFKCEDGTTYEMYHERDCCEQVDIEDINGDLDDLIGVPILKAEKVSNEFKGYCDSQTWTFYHLATRKGYVVIRWYGTSNGYYSETVEIRKL